MQRIVYLLGTIAAVLFAIMGGLFATAHQTSAIWFLCAGILVSFFAAVIHWRDSGQAALSPPTVQGPVFIHPPAPQPNEPLAERQVIAQPKLESFEPDEKDKQILHYLYRDDVDRLLNYIADGVHLDRNETKFRLNRLNKHGFVRLPGRPRPGRAPQYRLLDKGIGYILRAKNRL